MSDIHKHKCPDCNTIWEHDGELCAGNDKEHTCKCGKQVWHRHYENDNCRVDCILNRMLKLMKGTENA